MTGFYRLALASPELQIGDCRFNSEKIIALAKEAVSKGAGCVLFPELSLSGGSCGDLFYQSELLKQCAECADQIAESTAGSNAVVIFGMPIAIHDRVCNAMAVAANGSICGFILQQEPDRVFGGNNSGGENLFITSGNNDSVLAAENGLIFDDGNGFSFAVTFGRDIFAAGDVFSQLSLGGARIVFNAASIPATAGKRNRVFAALTAEAAKNSIIIASVNAGMNESVTDTLTLPWGFVSENGENQSLSCFTDPAEKILYADVDREKIAAVRRQKKSFPATAAADFSVVEIDPVPESPDLQYAAIPRNPFLSGSVAENSELCREAFHIQSAALAQRLMHIHARSAVIGVSGGLDSALALLVAARSCEIMGVGKEFVTAITMPGFGTTGRTKNNAVVICRELGIPCREINITEAAMVHFRDIGHDPDILDTTYENVQARERTQILMDIANKSGGIVVGTGDLSESALGWCTFNGDHMSMYSVNCSIPKTVIPHILHEAVTGASEALKDAIEDIINTPVSPELLPAAKDGSICQQTESIIGPYELHDFFIWNFCRYGFERARLQALAEHAFAGSYSRECIAGTLDIFIKRFFRMQFKRNCVPDGPQCFDVSLSPRGAWRMPSEASPEIWL